MSSAVGRRRLEQELDQLIDYHSVSRTIHAFVEVCHRRTPLGAQDWQEVCALLSAAEQKASEAGI